MAELLFNDGVFKIQGEGHVSVDRKVITADLLKALIMEPVDSEFFIPDLFDILDDESAALIRNGFSTLADLETRQTYERFLHRFVGLQVGHKWDLDALVVVWRSEIKTPLIDEVIRVRDGRVFVIITGTKEPWSEDDLHRFKSLRIGDYLDSLIVSATTLSACVKATLTSPIVGRKVCVSDDLHNIQTITAYGPSCLECCQWIMPKGFTFVSVEA